MKKLHLVIALAGLPFLSQAQKNTTAEKAVLDTTKSTPLANIDWSKMINRDFVCEGQNGIYNTLTLDPAWIIQVRFYARGMNPLINISRDGGRPLGFQTSKDSRIVAVRGLSDGGIGVILATSDRLGPFIETVTLTGFYNTSLTIQGLVQETTGK